ncbi:TolC family protein [Nannocystis radixulma]|uniref:TolC family protein n=1 Tax=Nannocystis radixulma TaxID=2995305 RepID=A0ABT5BMP0_9BACT|nr:TolC family protein [Nannocystis radixulma]MDC0675437.1 TolC family protein [Nannocystis radixulma]
MVLRASLLLLALTGSPSDAPAPACSGVLTRARVVECALEASPAVQSAVLGVEALAGRKRAARTILPSNPMVEATVASRRGLITGDRDINVYGRLSQELEIAGQRRKRMAMVDAETQAQQHRVDATRREVAAETLRVYYELLAAREQQAMLGRIAHATQLLVELAAQGEKAGLTSRLNADVIGTTVVKIRQQQVEADRRVATARALLANLLGVDPAAANFEVQGDMSPLAIEGEAAALVELALAHRAELGVAAAERDALKRQIEFYKRARVPNPSLVAYAQRDGFAEQVLGGGIMLPIPLPSPLGRTYAGEIAESKARVRQAEADIERVRRQVRAEVMTAFEAVRARRSEVALFDVDRISQAEGHLEALAQEMAAGRLPIRDAVVLQQAFLDLLASYIEARRALGLASVDLAQATGLLPPGATP